MSLSKETNGPQVREQNTLLLLIGKSGCGKSITGNMIFNSPVFVSRMSSSSVTRVSQTHTASVNDRRVTVVDTPDFRFSTHTGFDSDSELKRALLSCAPGAHVILLFLPLSTFTEQEQEFIHWFELKFGAEALRFTLVLFTHADKPHMRTLGELIRGNTQLSEFINRCGRRYHEFNIKAPANRRQVTELMEKVERLVSENSHSCYTLKMMEDEEKRRAEEEKERVRRETEIRVRREYEEEEQRRERMKPIKQITLKRICVIAVFSVVTGFVFMSKKESSLWMFMCGSITGGSAAAAGVCSGILWRLMWKSPLISSSSHDRPSALRHYLLKMPGVACGSVVGAAIGQIVGGNVLLVTSLAGLVGALTAI